MSLLRALTVWIMAFKMANTSLGAECKAEVVADVGHQGHCLDITIVVLIHAFHEYHIH